MKTTTNIGRYTDSELIELAKKNNGYKFIPRGWWILGFRSKEDEPDAFDDKFYVFNDHKCVYVMSGTTNSGTYGLLNFSNWGATGAAHIKGNEWYYNVWTRGLHNGKMPALRQTGAFKVIRDSDGDNKSGNSGECTLETFKGLNFHTNTYNPNNFVKRFFIGKWSTGCQVTNDVDLYHLFMQASKPQNVFSYCLIEEK